MGRVGGPVAMMLWSVLGFRAWKFGLGSPHKEWMGYLFLAFPTKPASLGFRASRLGGSCDVA